MHEPSPEPSPDLTPEQIKGLRLRLGLKRCQFASRYRIPVGTVRTWESGKRPPDSGAMAFLRLLRDTLPEEDRIVRLAHNLEEVIGKISQIPHARRRELWEHAEQLIAQNTAISFTPELSAIRSENAFYLIFDLDPEDNTRVRKPAGRMPVLDTSPDN